MEAKPDGRDGIVLASEAVSLTSLFTNASLAAGLDDDERATRFWAAIDEKFLEVMNWDPAGGR
jgi:hypothetical protein